ncbi:MAG: hypothetical protein AAFN93_13755 [Bacteroidota bacterium]
MRTFVIVIFGVLISNLSFGQCQYANPTSELGIGLVEYDNYNHRTPVFEVFNDPELTEKFCSWNIYDEDNLSPFCAKYHKPDYGIAQVVVLDSLDKSYKVLVNQQDIKYVPKNINYVFWSWQEYLTESHGIRRRIEIARFKNQPLRTQPNILADIVTLPGERFELFCVMEVRGDWVKVKYDCFYNSDQNPHEGMPCSTYINECINSATGWLKWRIDNEVTVDIFLMA